MTADRVDNTIRTDNGMSGEELLVASRGRELADACADNPTVIEDLRFLDAWERGLVPSLGALLRARQIRRANPARTVKDR
jgi:hypothetical protein